MSLSPSFNFSSTPAISFTSPPLFASSPYNPSTLISLAEAASTLLPPPAEKKGSILLPPHVTASSPPPTSPVRNPAPSARCSHRSDDEHGGLQAAGAVEAGGLQAGGASLPTTGGPTSSFAPNILLHHWRACQSGGRGEESGTLASRPHPSAGELQWRRRRSVEREGEAGGLLTVNFCQPSHEFTFGVGINLISYPLVLTPLI
jgi:hypothetical protein